MFCDIPPEWSCSCGEGDLSKLQYHSNTGEYTCTSCGLVHSELSIDGLVHIGRFQPLTEEQMATEPANFRAKQFKESYQRRVHLHERFSAHNRREPRICKTDMVTIKNHHHILVAKNWFYQRLFETGQATKREIQTLLRFVDAKEVKAGRTKRFCKKYLERWNSLLEQLGGIKLPPFTSYEAARLGAEFLRLSNLWDQYVIPLQDCVAKSLCL